MTFSWFLLKPIKEDLKLSVLGAVMNTQSCQKIVFYCVTLLSLYFQELLGGRISASLTLKYFTIVRGLVQYLYLFLLVAFR